ncbi:MAG: SAM-dependent methyltransferase [Acidimicrobiia bacterium]|nr:SAM-dependent methyltransferase [Acidimicrobiia bacterium]
MTPPRLTVVGTGIKAGLQLTAEASQRISRSAEVYYLATEPATAQLIENLNGNATSLADLYQPEKPRQQTYSEMADVILSALRQGKDVCAAFYGHPSILTTPARIAMGMAREEGYETTILPGISAEDCLYADLGIDPIRSGCQSYLAADFLLRPRRFDLSTPLVLWQITTIGEPSLPDTTNNPGLRLLAERLVSGYGSDHEVIIYTASAFAIGRPTIDHVKLADLATADIPLLATLYVPPQGRPQLDRDMALRIDGDSATQEETGSATAQS